MPILTNQEACDQLRYSAIEDMPPNVTSLLLPGIDECIRTATGKDWGTLTETYTAVDPVAKLAASILLVRWFEDQEEIGKSSSVVGLITQLAAKYQKERQAVP